jgi:hypothetical protein
MSKELQQPVQDHKRRDGFRRQLRVTTPNDKSQEDLPNKSSNSSPLPTDLVHKPGTKKHPRNRKQCKNELPQSNSPHIMIWHDRVDDCRRHNAILKIDEVVQKEGTTSSEKSEPVFLDDQFPRNMPFLEIALSEEASILNFQSEQDDQEWKENGKAIHGVVCNFQIVGGGEECYQVGKRAYWTSRCCH